MYQLGPTLGYAHIPGSACTESCYWSFSSVISIINYKLIKELSGLGSFLLEP